MIHSTMRRRSAMSFLYARSDHVEESVFQISTDCPFLKIGPNLSPIPLLTHLSQGSGVPLYKAL